MTCMSRAWLMLLSGYLLSLLAVIVNAQAPHARSSSTQTIWAGTAGPVRWKWTTADLTASSAVGGRRLFSAAAFEKRANPSLKETKDEPYEGFMDCSIQSLSVVGSIAS